MDYIYILELSNSNYYIGKTKNVAKRFIEHKEGNGASWTKLHGGCKLIELREATGIFDEDMITLEYMNIYGIDHVRGGAYVTIVLPEEQKTQVERMCRSANDLCQGCGLKGHYESKCPTKNKKTIHKILLDDDMPPKTKKIKCKKCNYYGHTENECLGLASKKGAGTDHGKLKKCNKCNRYGHEYFNCYAKTVV